MAYEHCLALLREAAPKLTDEDFEFILSSLDRKAKFYEARGLATDSETAMQKASKELANDIKTAALIERRNAVLNKSKRIARVAWARQTFGTRISEAIETILVGTNRATPGARDGVMQMQNLLTKRYQAGFTADLVAGDLHGIWASGTMDREAARALWAFGKPDEAAQLAKLPKEAVDIARITSKWQEVTRLDANREGAWVGKLDGYITRQSHDPYRIRVRGGTDGVDWKADAAGWFDTDRMMAESDQTSVDEMLTGLYINLASGNHMKAVSEPSGGFTGTRNLAKKLSQERVIHFKDSDAWFDYNQKYGAGNLRESVAAGLRHSAQATGLMKVLGTNPKDAIKRIESELVLAAKDAGDVAQLDRLGKDQKTLGYYMDAVDGTMNAPGNAIWARRVSNILGWETLSKLGSMIASQFNDIAIYGAAARHDGRPFLGSMAEAVGNLGQNLKAKEKFDLYASLDVALESMVGELGRTGSFNEAGGMSKALQLFMKWNLATPWTERLRAGAQTGLSHYLALQKGRAFGSLDKDLQRKLGVYGIGSDQWNLLRSVAEKNVDGREYITPEQVRDIPDSEFHQGITDKGLTVNDANVAEAKRALEDQLRNYFVDRTGFYVIDTDAKSRALMLRGTQPGTWEGSFARFIMQFKGFSGAYLQKSLGQEFYGRGFQGDGLLNALKNGNGEALGLARLIGVSTILGYASLSLKDLMKNKTPRDVTDPDKAWKTFLASAAQGGGLGIYGDFLFADASRMGSGTVESLAGPAISDVGRVVDLYHKAIRGDDVASNAVNTMLNSVPVNILGSRTALDYLIIHDLQEQMNPGYLRRTERQMEKDYGQQFLVRPQ